MLVISYHQRHIRSDGHSPGGDDVLANLPLVQLFQKRQLSQLFLAGYPFCFPTNVEAL